jgi:hypothetical protein
MGNQDRIQSVGKHTCIIRLQTKNKPKINKYDTRFRKIN